jgi:hypothetical protein
VSTRILHIEPTTDPDDGSEYGILDQDRNELAVVSGGKELAQQFAAAPDLLEALRELIEQFDVYRNGWMGAWSDRVGLARDMERAREALAKAEGRT